MGNENFKDEELKIPEHCTSKGEIAEGFGKEELAKASIGSLIGVIVGGIIALITKNYMVNVMVGLVAFSFGGYIFCKKDRYSRTSIVDTLVDMRKFYKSQKQYYYRRDK